MRIGRVAPAALATVIAGAGAVGVITVASANATGAHSVKAPATLSVKSTKLGKILVNSAGQTVYIYSRDKQGSNKSLCDETCLVEWPLVIATGKPRAGTGVNSKLLGSFKEVGETVITYNGWPLHTYLGDTAAGETHGQDKDRQHGYWYVITPAGTPIK